MGLETSSMVDNSRRKRNALREAPPGQTPHWCALVKLFMEQLGQWGQSKGSMLYNIIVPLEFWDLLDLVAFSEP